MKIRLNESILTLYLTIITISSVYLYGTRNKFLLCLIIAGLLVFFYLASYLILKFIRNLEIRRPAKDAHGLRTRVFLLSFVFAFFVFMVCFTAAYPGTFETDCITQLKQAVTGKYDDWHPIWHTLVYFTFPYKLFGSASSIVILQILYLSLAIGYMSAIIYKYAGLGWSIGSFAWIVLNPFTLYISVSPLKDVGFATVSLVAMTIAADVLLERDHVNATWLKCAVLGFMLANATIFRHNGLLFSLFLLFALFFGIDFRKWAIAAVVTVLTIAVIEGPVYKYIDAEHVDTSVIQVVGLPMSIIGNVAKETPDLLDDETREFVFGIAPQEIWNERYSRGNFNLMKYGGMYNPDIIEEAGVVKIVSMSIRAAAVSPQAALESFFALTDFVYGWDVREKADIDVITMDSAENDLGISWSGSPSIRNALNRYHSLIRLKGINFTRKLCFSLLAVIAAVLATCSLSSLDDWKRLFISFPILAYDFGTMLLLSGHDARFFFVSFLICPLTVVAILAGNGIDKEVAL